MILTGACAGYGSGRPTVASPGISGWPLAELAAAKQARAILRTDSHPVAVVDTRALRAAWQAGVRLRATSEGEWPDLLITEGSVANAYAFYQDGRPFVGINVAMLALLGDDEAAWAALIGHELAHLRLRHQDLRERRRATGETTSELLGVALAIAGVPFGSTFADTATTLVERGYSRDDEREADRVGVGYLLAAGYDPEGAIRLQERLAAGTGGQPLPFLSTHPSGSERVGAMRALIREMSPQPK